MKRCFGALNPTNAPEEPHEEEGDDDGGDDGQGEAPNPMLHAVEQVHTEDAGDECGEHENDAHRGHRFHRLVHVVADDRSVGFDGRFENVGVDVGGFTGLTHLDIDVFNHIGVEFVDGEFELQFGKEGLVAANGSGEVRERVLESRKVDEIGVVDGAIQIALGTIDDGADLFEAFQVPNGARQEETEDEVDGVGEAQAASFLIGDEIDHHIGFEVANAHANFTIEEHTERNGGVGRTAVRLFLVGYAKNDEYPALIVVVAGTLIFISDVVEKVIGDVKFVDEVFFLFFCGASGLHPIVRLPVFLGLQPVLVVPIREHSELSSVRTEPDRKKVECSSYP